MSDIIGGENHFPLGFGSTDRTFDLDFSAGDSAFGLDFGSAIIGGSSLPPTDNADAGDALRLFHLRPRDPLVAEWLPVYEPAFFQFRLDADGNVIHGPTWAEILAIEEERLVVATVSTPMFARVYHLVCFSHRASGAISPTTIVFSGAVEDSIITIVNGETEDSWETNLFAGSSAIDDAIGGFSEAVIGDLADLDTSDQSNLVEAINEVNEKAGESEIFWATYGTTTAQEIHDAKEAGKLCCLMFGDETYVLSSITLNTTATPMFYHAVFVAPVEHLNGIAEKLITVSRNSWDNSFVALPTSGELELKYTKPDTGIPKTDLASDVQTSLGKADAALPTTGNAYRTASIPMGQLDSSSTATDMTATVPGIMELRDGVCMWLKNGVVSSASGVTLDINGLGAKPLYSSLAAATRSTTIFSASYTLLFIYNSTRVDGGCWDVVYGIDTNTNTIGYQLRTNSATMPMASVVYRYRLLFTSADGTHLVPANNSTSTNATSSRTVCQTPIDPFGTIYYYGATASVAADSNPGAASMWTRYVITLGYSFNRTGAALVLTPNVPVYIKCAPQTNGSAIIDADNPYVQTLPSTEDGKIYIFLGIAASATTVEIQENHPVYCYRKGAIRKWTGLEAELDSLIVADNVGY